MTQAHRIGLLGGTFDPIHIGHLSAADVARKALALDRVLLLPSHVPPHRVQPFASVPHRFAMVALAADAGEGLLASDLELVSPGPSYTSATLQRLHTAGYRPWQLFFILGADAFAEIATWREYPRFLDHAHFAVIDRAGRAAADMPAMVPALAERMVPPMSAEPPPAEGPTRIFLVGGRTPDVSATDIRARCATGRSVAGLVPDAVARHIDRHALYRGGQSHSIVAGPREPAASQLHEQEHL